MHKVFASTGAFIGRANGKNFQLLKDILPKVECDGFELMLDREYYGREDELTAFLLDMPYKFPTVHIEKTIGELLARKDFDEARRNFEKNCQIAKKIGAKLAVMHLWNGIVSDSNIEANLSAYDELAKIADGYGILLTAENVLAHNNTPLTLLKRLYERCPGAWFTYDTKMADFDNENAVAFDDGHGWLWPRVRHMHINDRAGAYRDWNSIRALPIGRGQIDFDGIFASLHDVGYSGDFTVESTCLAPDGRVRVEDMNDSVRRVRELVG